MKIKLLLFFIIGLIFSCSKDDENKIAGLGDFSGKFKLSYVAGIDVCTNRSKTKQGTNSENDLEIFSDGRFKRKIYSLNSNNECTVSEILEGQITITGAQDIGNIGKNWYPYGIVAYDNSKMNDKIWIVENVNGIHNEIDIKTTTEKGLTVTYSYGRTDW